MFAQCKPRAARVWGKGSQTSNWKIKYSGAHFWAGHPFVTRAADHSISWDYFILVLWTMVSWYNPSRKNKRKIYSWVPPVPHLSRCPLLGCETFCIFTCMTATFRQLLGGVCLSGSRLVNSGGSRESYMVPMIWCQQQELSRGRALGKRKCVRADLSWRSIGPTLITFFLSKILSTFTKSYFISNNNLFNKITKKTVSKMKFYDF